MGFQTKREFLSKTFKVVSGRARSMDRLPRPSVRPLLPEIVKDGKNER